MEWNTNFKQVKVRNDRYCSNCGIKHKKGSIMLTVNIYPYGRRWLCDKECFEEYEKECIYESEWVGL